MESAVKGLEEAVSKTENQLDSIEWKIDTYENDIVRAKQRCRQNDGQLDLEDGHHEKVSVLNVMKRIHIAKKQIDSLSKESHETGEKIHQSLDSMNLRIQLLHDTFDELKNKIYK